MGAPEDPWLHVCALAGVSLTGLGFLRENKHSGCGIRLLAWFDFYLFISLWSAMFCQSFKLLYQEEVRKVQALRVSSSGAGNSQVPRPGLAPGTAGSLCTAAAPGGWPS